ncbi:MAG: transposase [Desulfobacteraceae bacterium]|nr:transposase [Desulfobacteraceae bacterium]
MLPIPYFHLVFTIPESLKPFVLKNQRVVCDIIFKAASETLKDLGKDPKNLGTQVGFFAILHTWSQTLMDHPHVH